MRQVICKIFAALLVCGFSVCGYAATYYVEDQSSIASNIADEGATAWGNATSETTPSSAGTAMARAVAGDTVIFLDGTYDVGPRLSGYEHFALEPANSGSSGNEITFQAETRWGVTIVGQNTAGTCDIYEACVFGSYGQSYIVWDGFIAQGEDYTDSTPVPAKCGAREGADYVILKNCKFIGVDGWESLHSCNIEGVRFETVDYCEVQNCYLQDYMHSTPGEHNYSAFKSYVTTNCVVEYSTITNSTAGLYQKQNGEDDVYRYNFLFENYVGVLVEEAKPTVGGTLDVHGNIIANSDYAGLQGIDNDYGTSITWWNNVFHDNGTYQVSFDEDTSPSSFSHWNNIYIGSVSGTMIRGVHSFGDLDYSDYNVYYGAASWTMRDYEGDESNYASFAAWQASSESGGSAPDGNGSDSNPNLEPDDGTMDGSEPEDYQPDSESLAAIRTGGRGGVYESYIGAWEWPLDSSQQIGYSSPDVSTSLRTGGFCTGGISQ